MNRRSTYFRHWAALALIAAASAITLGVNPGLLMGRTSASTSHLASQGSSWVPANNGLPSRLAVITFAVSGPSLFAGTTLGVFRSIDNGQSWTPVNSGLTNVFVTALAVSGANLFAGTAGGGVFRLADNGQSWTQVNAGLANLHVNTIVVSGNTLFVGALGSGVFRSTDGGQNLVPVNAGLPVGSNIQELAVSGVVVLAATFGDGIFRSTDAGESWAPINAGLTNLFVNSLLIDGPALYAGTNGGVYRSINQGQNWAIANTGLTNLFALRLAASGNSVFVGTDGGGVFLSTNNGQSWSAINNGLANLSVRAFAVSGNNLFAGTLGGGIFFIPLTSLACAYEIAPANQSFGNAGGSGSVAVTTSPGCAWTASSNASWIVITGGGGSGNGTVTYSVAANLNASVRTATLTIAGRTFTVTQAGVNSLSVVSAASISGPEISPESLVSGFGVGLATRTQDAAILSLPTSLAGTTIAVRDSAGIQRLAGLSLVSPTQVNFLIPPGTATGAATIIVTSGDGTLSAATAQIANVAPGLFTANGNGQGVASGVALRITGAGAQIFEPIAQFDSAQNRFVARPIDLGPASDQVFLVLFATGIRLRSNLSAVIARIGGAAAQVLFAGAAPGLPGLDQINLSVPRSLAARGLVDIVVTVEGKTSNIAQVSFGSAFFPAPALTSLSPSSAAAGSPGFTMTLSGVNFTNGSVVRWNGSDRTTTFVSSASLRALIPASDLATAGTASVTVFNPGQGGVSNALSFTINNLAPTITSLSPGSAIAGGPGFTLTVNGANFGFGSILRWNGSDRPTVLASSAELTALIPASDIANPGTALITVFSPGGVALAITFNIFPDQTRRLRITDGSGSPGGGATVSVELIAQGNENALGFSLTFDPAILSNPQATLGSGASGAAFSINSTQVASGRLGIAIALPSGRTFPPGTRQVLVVTFSIAAGGGASSTTVGFGDQPVPREIVDTNANALTAQYTAGAIIINVANPAPSLASLSPGIAAAGGPGFTLTVLGANFRDSSIVRWNGSNRTTTFISSTELSAQIPASDIATAGTASVTVFVPAPGGGVSNVLSFRIDPVSVISGNVSYCLVSRPVPGTTLTATDAGGGVLVTGASGFDGNYTLARLGAGSFTVTPGKSGDVNGVSAFDAALVLRHVASVIRLAGCQASAADANRDGQLTTADARLIAEQVVGLTSGGQAGNWTFNPLNRAYPSLPGAQANQNYDALLVGEVSGNWSPAATLAITSIDPVRDETGRPSLLVKGAAFRQGLSLSVIFPHGGEISLGEPRIQRVTADSFTARFTLDSRGMWTLRVINPDGQQSESFTIIVP